MQLHCGVVFLWYPKYILTVKITEKFNQAQEEAVSKRQNAREECSFIRFRLRRLPFFPQIHTIFRIGQSGFYMYASVHSVIYVEEYL